MEAFFPELIVRLFYVLVIHGLATQKKKSLFKFGRNMEKGSLFFFQICVSIFLTKAIKMKQRLNGQIPHWQTWRTGCYCFVAKTQKTHTWKRTLQS